MNSFAQFFSHNIIVIYFFYGLAFFCMGLFVWVESRRSSSFRLARAMGPLAGFGIIHGLHEWFEMFQRLQDQANIPEWLLSDQIRLAHLVVSFALLLLFGVRLVYANRRAADGRGEQIFAYVVTGSLLLIWAASALLTRQVYNPRPSSFVTVMDVLARYILGIPGALLAAWAIVLEQRDFQRQGLPDTGRDLLRGALALLLYGVVGQVFVKPSFLFPASVVNANLFLQVFGIPIQLFRAVLATVMAVFMVRGMRAFDLERQQQLTQANLARMAAQEEALAAQLLARQKMEQLNLDLETALADLTVLYDFARVLDETLEVEGVVEAAVSRINNRANWISGSAVLLPAQNNGSLTVVKQRGLIYPTKLSTAESEKRVMAIATSVVENNEVSYWCCNRAVPASQAKSPGESCGDSCDSGCLLGIPLRMQHNDMNGALVMRVASDWVPLGQRELDLLQTLAGQLGIALDNALLYTAVQEREALRGELLHQVVTAQEHERQRIARELHDGTGQMLTALGLGFAAASQSVQSDVLKASQQLTQLKEMSMQALLELRNLIADLRPSLLDDLGLIPALQNQIDEFAKRMSHPKHPFETKLIVNGRPVRLHADLELVVYRIVQEALTNVAKHAQATAVTVTLSYLSEEMLVVVHDNGIGFDPGTVLPGGSAGRNAWGVLGMQERVALVGGRFQVQSAPNSGTTIEINLPLLGEGANYVENSFVVSR